MARMLDCRLQYFVSILRFSASSRSPDRSAAGDVFLRCFYRSIVGHFPDGKEEFELDEVPQGVLGGRVTGGLPVRPSWSSFVLANVRPFSVGFIYA